MMTFTGFVFGRSMTLCFPNIESQDENYQSLTKEGLGDWEE